MTLSLSEVAEFKKEVAERYSVKVHFCDSCGGQSFAAESPTEEFKKFVTAFFNAKMMRYELKRKGVKSLKVVYSKEKPITPIDDMAISCRTHCIFPPDTARKCTQRRRVPDSNAFVPSVAGLIIAGEVMKDLTEKAL